MNSNEIIGHTKVQENLKNIIQSTNEGSGSILFLAGEAGIGKSFLAENSLEDKGFAYYIGRSPGSRTHAYGLIASALRNFIANNSNKPPDIGHLTPHLNHILPELGPAPEQRNADTLITTIISAITLMANQQPAALILEDLQNADNSSLELLISLSERIQTIPLIVFGLYRPEEIGEQHRLRWVRSELRRRDLLEEFSLHTLSKQKTGQLLGQYLQSEPNEYLINSVFEKSGGIPLYIIQLAEGLLSGGFLQEDENRIRLKEPLRFPIPESIKDAVLMQLQGLSHEAQNALEMVSVLGKEINLNVLPKPSGTHELLQRNILQRGKRSTLEFKSTITREVMLETIGEKRKQALHAQVADSLEKSQIPPGQIAEHWLAAGNKSNARNALIAEAKRSCDLYAFRDAADAIRNLLEIWPEDEQQPRRMEMLKELAHCAHMCGELQEAENLLSRLSQSYSPEENPSKLGEIYQKMAVVYELQGKVPQMIDARRNAAGAFVQANKLAAAARDLLLVSEYSIGMGMFDSAKEVLENTNELTKDNQEYGLQSRVLGLLGYVLAMQGKIKKAESVAKAGLSMALERNQNEIAGEIYRRLAGVYEYSSRFPEAQKAYSKAFQYCETHGAEDQVIPCLGCMAWIKYRVGAWKEAQELSRKVLEEQQAPPVSRATALVVLGLIDAWRGRAKSARKLLHEGLDTSQSNRIDLLTLILIGSLAQAAHINNHTEDADHYYQKLLQLWEKIEDRHDVLSSFTTAASFYAIIDNQQALSRVTTALDKIASETGNPETIGALAYAIGETQMLQGNYTSASERFHTAVDKFKQLEIPLELLQADYRLGVCYLESGRGDNATAHLNKALRIAKKLGVRPLTDEISETMRNAGINPEETRDSESAERSARAGLTRRQLEVARLIASGMTNKEIADELFLSPRTVEMHVSNLLNRLDCRSRSEAVKIMAEMNLL